MHSEAAAEYRVGIDRDSHRHWLRRERDKSIVLWVKAAEAGLDDAVVKRHQAIAIALGEALDALEAMTTEVSLLERYYVPRPNGGSKQVYSGSNALKRIPPPERRISAEEWSNAQRIPFTSYDLLAVAAALFVMMAAIVVMT